MTHEEELCDLLGTYDKSDDVNVKEILQTHLQSSSFNINLKNKNYNNWTCLHVACLYNRYEMVFELLKHPNINTNIQDIYGQTPLHYACYSNDHVESVKLLLDDARVDINFKSNIGNTPLMRAAIKGFISLIEYILASLRADIASIPEAIKQAKNKKEIVSLLEAYLSQPVATANKLRKKLGLVGKFSFFPTYSFIKKNKYRITS
jgi:ankyrin repeat protein